MVRNILVAPQKLCIYDQSDADFFYSFIFNVNELALTKNKLVVLDLSGVELITAAASVLLFATVNTCQLTSGNSSQITFKLPSEKSNPSGHNHIVKTGLSRALYSGSLEKLDDLIASQIFYQSSTEPSTHYVNTCKFLVSKLRIEKAKLLSLTSAISEAMLNVSHHAYKDPQNNGEIQESKKDIVSSIGERWWQCTWHNESTNHIFFIICDLGLGIVDTYNPQRYGNATDKRQGMKDAFTIGGSRFKGKGRGNGSEDIKRALDIDGCEKEGLLVYTKGIKYYYNTDMKEAKIENTSRTFHGTLIEWSIDLGDKTQ